MAAAEARRRWLAYLFTLCLLLWPTISPSSAVAAAPTDDLALASPLAPHSRDSTPSRSLSHEEIERIFSGGLGRPPEEGRGSTKYELADLVLVTTVADGAIHALKRETGQWMWTLHDSDAVRARSVLGPLVRSTSTTSPSANASSHDLSDATRLPEETYIIEPGTGAIFLHLRSTGVMQRLPLTISALVDSSPFTFADDTTRMFVGRKTTQLVGVDLASGKMVGIFGPEAGWCEWRTRPGMTGAGAGQYECEDGIDSRPQDLLYLGRTGPSNFSPLAHASVH